MYKLEKIALVVLIFLALFLFALPAFGVTRVPVSQGGTGTTTFSSGVVMASSTEFFVASSSPSLGAIFVSSSTLSSWFLGKVGIGTSTPGYELQVVQSDGSLADFAVNRYGGGGVWLAGDAGHGYVTSFKSGGNLYLRTGGGGKNIISLIDSTGYAGIGTGTPASKLHIYKGQGGGSLPTTAYDVLSVENNDNGYVNVLTPLDKTGGILFSDDTRGQGQLLYRHASDQMAVFTGGSQKMVIDSSGFMGIGDTTPSSLLTVGTGDAFRVGSDGQASTTSRVTAQKGFSVSGVNAYASVNNAPVYGIGYSDLAIDGATYNATQMSGYYGLSFVTSSVSGSAVPRMVVTQSGKVGIGTTTPFSRLHVSNGSSATSTITIGEVGSQAGCINLVRKNGTLASIYISDTGALITETNACR